MAGGLQVYHVPQVGHHRHGAGPDGGGAEAGPGRGQDRHRDTAIGPGPGAARGQGGQVGANVVIQVIYIHIALNPIRVGACLVSGV